MSEERNYSHIHVGNVQEHLLKFDAKEDGVNFEATVFYIPAVTSCGLDYLHRDGVVRMGTSGGSSLERLLEGEGENHLLKTEDDVWNMYTGYFPTREAAEHACELYNGTAHYQ